MLVKITFLGAVGTVTGSRYLIEHKGRYLLVDCGLFQGEKDLRERNWKPFPIDSSKIDAVLLTHAHIDHSGYIPRLIKEGFKGRIYCSQATFDLCKILLPDSGHLQEEDAASANRNKYSRHSPALPLYTEKDALHALQYFQGVDWHRWYELDGGLRFRIHFSGHILGAASIALSDSSRTILFSGDLGSDRDPLLIPPKKGLSADYLVVESTYGNRLHEKTAPSETLGEIIRSTAAKGGSVIIPAFAVGRTQTLLYYIRELKKSGAIPNLPIFLDSPMAVNATELMCRYSEQHCINIEACRDVCGVSHYIRTVEESKKLNMMTQPAIIISASGMATGGRVLHHIKHRITNSQNTILFVGYQAQGTRGQLLVEGAKEIKIHGEIYPVKARIVNIESLSAHADYQEVVEWMKSFVSPPSMVFITHGEGDAALFFKNEIESQLKWKAEVPHYLQSYDLI